MEYLITGTIYVNDETNLDISEMELTVEVDEIVVDADDVKGFESYIDYDAMRDEAKEKAFKIISDTVNGMIITNQYDFKYEDWDLDVEEV